MSPIRGRFRALASLVLTLAALTAATACSGGDSAGPLPDARKTLQEASTAMAGVTSVGFTLKTEGQPSVSVKSGDIELLKSGDAQGTLQVTQLGQAVEMNFVLLGETVYYKGVTGGYQRLPRSMVTALYDPSAVLDPNRGIAKLLATATEPKTEKREKVDGKDTYKIKAGLPRDVATALVPGVTEALPGHVWIGTADHRPVRVRLEIPGAAGAGGSGGAMIVSFTEFNAAYKIVKPV